MLAKRNVRILKRLMQEKDYLTIQQLSKELDITTRAIRYDVELIDQFLIDNNLSKIDKTPNKGIRLLLDSQELKKLQKVLGSKQKDNYIYTKEERQIYVLNKLLFNKGVVPLQEVADELFVSVSTINKDIVNVKHDFEKYGLHMEYTLKDCYEISGSEKDIRSYFSNLYLTLLNDNFVYQNRTLQVYNENNLMDATMVSSLTKLIEKLEDTFQLKLTDDSLLYMVSHLYVMSIRIKNHYEIKSIPTDIKAYIENTSLYPRLLAQKKEIEEHLQIILKANEMYYFTQYLLSARFIFQGDTESDKNVYFMVIVDLFIQEVSKELNYDFTKEVALHENLLQHFEPMFNRVVLHTQIDNPLLEKIKLQFSDLFQAVKTASKVISDFCGNSINEEEIAYLCMHFGMIVNRSTTKRVKSKRVVIVCPSGYATSMMICTALETNYYVEVIKVLPLRLLEKELPTLEYDCLISSVNIDSYRFPYIKVNPILSFNDIVKLNQIFVEKLQFKNATLDSIMDIIKVNCDIINEKELEEQLSVLLQMKRSKSTSRKAEKMLIDVINKDLIELNVEATDWKDAIRKGGQLLVEQGVAKESYVDAMIQSAITIGPYIVLEKGIALPHAAPQDNTFKIGVSIITLKTPVEFGHEENDPVSLVICLASTDASSHMQVLADIGKIFDEEDLSNKIVNAQTKEEVLDIITSISNA